MTVPTKFSGMSMVRCSTGSMSLPSTRLVTISGRPTISSKPSRRIISIRIGELQFAAAEDLEAVRACRSLRRGWRRW